MRIELTYSKDGETLTAKPLVKRERFPYILELLVEGAETYAITENEKIILGHIPVGYEMISKDKYEIGFKTNTPKIRTKKIIDGSAQKNSKATKAFLHRRYDTSFRQ